MDTSRGSVSVWPVGKRAYASVATGHLSHELALLIMRVGEARYGSGIVHGFHDWLDMTGYDSASRVTLTDWVMSHRPESRLYIGVRSRIVRMGVTVANLALGNLITIRQTREELEADVREALQVGA